MNVYDDDLADSLAPGHRATHRAYWQFSMHAWVGNAYCRSARYGYKKLVSLMQKTL